MTLAHAQLRTPLSPRSGHALPASLAIAWEIRARSLLVSPGAKVLNGHAKRLRTARLRIRIELSGMDSTGLQGTCLVHADLDAALDRSERDQIELTPSHVGQWSLDVPTGRVLVQVPGVLDAVVECDASGHAERAVYARTPLLQSALGLPGGVYDAPELVAITP
ncbi:MAG: hypothetical protein K2W85_09240 [Phycisphaerales bacterium]|nr:hypothetical protein [Phycisphaerales bacterium]